MKWILSKNSNHGNEVISYFWPCMLEMIVAYVFY
jgi:hypothetical protein